MQQTEDKRITFNLDYYFDTFKPPDKLGILHDNKFVPVEILQDMEKLNPHTVITLFIIESILEIKKAMIREFFQWPVIYKKMFTDENGVKRFIVKDFQLNFVAALQLRYEGYKGLEKIPVFIDRRKKGGEKRGEKFAFEACKEREAIINEG